MITDSMLFLLGGYDLEMIAIRELLMEQSFSEIEEGEKGKEENAVRHFADKKLVWGASLSSYQSFFTQPGTIYGIELTGDIDPPANYKRIDHHNELAHLPSSLEQVAALLEVSLDRYRQLVAANDRGFIPAMKALEATEEEISEIRKKDRQAQGVTEQDEMLAEESIANQLAIKEGTTIIRSLTDKFSPITDRMYGKAERLLVYTARKLVYYGKGASRLATHYSGLIQERKAYSGGGREGYFGMTESLFVDTPPNEDLIKEILLISN